MRFARAGQRERKRAWGDHGRATTEYLARSNPLDDVLARLLVDPIERESLFTIDLRNLGQDAATVADPEWSFIGSHTGDSPPADSVSVVVPAAPISGGGVSALQLDISPAKINPDLYHGAVTVGLAGAKDRTAFTVDLLLRRGPTMPTIFILAGVLAVFGVAALARRQASRVAAEHGTQSLRAALSKADPADKTIVDQRVSSLFAAKDNGRWGDGETGAVADLVSSLDSLGIVRTLERRIPTAVASSFERTLGAINGTRQLVANGDAATAATQADVATIAWGEEAQALAAREDAEAQAGRTGHPFIEELGRQNIIFADGGLVLPSRRSASARRSFQLPQLPPAVRDTAIKWGWYLVRFGSLGVFVYLGLRVVYIDHVETFTGGLVPEAIPLVVWGIGADTVARFLGGLTKPKAA